MGAGLVARISKPRRARGYFFVARLESKTMSVAVLADIGMAAVSHGEVYDKAAHQCSRSRERYLPRMMLPTTRISKFKHLSVLPWTKILIRLTFPATTPSWVAKENRVSCMCYFIKNIRKIKFPSITLPGSTSPGRRFAPGSHFLASTAAKKASRW